MKNFSPDLRAGRAILGLYPVLILIFLITGLNADARASTVTQGTQRFRLDNGLKVILKEDHSAPVASVQVWVKTGSANETEEEAGLTHFIEHMIFKGTPTRKAGEIARTIEVSGGHINAYTSFDRTVYFVEIASRHFDTALEILLDVVQHSTFDPEELSREKEVVLEEYRRSLDRPRTRLSWAMMDLCYDKHPYRRPVIGYESTIRSFDRQAVLTYMDKWYTPKNMVLVAVGDFNALDTLKTIKELFKDFPERTGQTASRPVEPEQTSPRSLLLNEDVQQLYLDMSWHIPSITHPHIPALDLMEIILGHGNSSRLYNRLKMEKNVVHSIYASAYAMSDPGLFTIGSALSPERLDSTLETVAQVIARISSEPVSGSELSRARKIVEAYFIFDMEDMKGQARTLSFFETMTGDMHNADKYLEQLRKVTADDIMDVAARYLRPENLSAGIMAPEGSRVNLSEQRIMEVFSQAQGKESVPPEQTAQGDDWGKKITLPNGMRVVIKENHRLPLVSLRLAMLGGSRLERPEQSGISGFTSRMLTRGTGEKSASEVASIVDSLAGGLETFSGRNSFGITAKFLSKDLYPGLDLIADLILNPAFPESEVEKIREDILSSIRAKKDSPRAQLSDLFNSTVYRAHPYGRARTGTEESIGSIKRTDLMRWYRSLAVPSNLVFVVVGDVHGEEFMARLKELFKDFNGSVTKMPEILPEPPLQQEREVHLERPGEQVHLMIGYLGADLMSRDNAVMEIIETALSGMGGRLFRELRDKQSLAYSVSAFRRPGLETGLFGVYLACDPKKLRIAIKAVFREMERIKKEGLTEKELEDTKNYLLGNQAIDLQTNGSQAMHIALDELYGLGYNHIRQYIREIEAVSCQDIRRAAQRFIIPDRYTLATVGPMP
ncbi:MAG: insulinase family protein [Deltaproteobacteria bacterium]|nr:insulinase family protein [Deltaproteobacteria bacterium]